jgi:formamidopyrimidine-DNA glycosylase
MDARKVVGVGNIYASEALFRAKIRPAKRAGRINEVEARELVDAIQSVLVQAIAAGGSTIRDFKGADGYRGGFQDLHLVYGRAGELCRQCGTKIVSKQITGRSTFWCPHCQLR